MPKKRPIQGQPKEILYFLVPQLSSASDRDPDLHGKLSDAFAERGVSVLEFESGRGSIALINESPFAVTLDELYAVFDELQLLANYSRSEFV